MKFFVALALLLAFVCAAIAQDLAVHPDLTQDAEDTACLIVHSDLTTSDPPALVLEQSGFLTIDTLTLTLRVSKRYITAHANMSGAIGDFCSGSFSVIPDGIAQCTVLVQANIAWGDARSKCGVYLDTSVTGDHLVFRGSVLLDLTETNLPTIRTRDLSRLVHSVFPFLIRFPTTVSTGHNITAYFPVTLDAAIIRQFDVRTPAATTTAQSSIRLFTSVQYPFLLTLPVWHTAVFATTLNTFVLQPVVGTTAYLLAGEDCLDSPTDTVCEQEWLIEFDAPASPPVCDFSGVFTLNFTVRCEAGADAHCPLPLVADGNHEAPATVVMTINTENFCPQMFADVPATATLASFQDVGLTIPKSDFLQGDTIYFLASADSTKATITSTTVDTVTIDYPTNNHILLYDSAAPSATYVTLGVHGAKTAPFSVPLNPATFPVPLEVQSNSPSLSF